MKKENKKEPTFLSGRKVSELLPGELARDEETLLMLAKLPLVNPLHPDSEVQKEARARWAAIQARRAEQARLEEEEKQKK